MGFGMSMKPCLRMVIRCGICNQKKHSPDCPAGVLEALTARQRHIPCPKCSGGTIGINANDDYECRNCHTRFTCGCWADSENPEHQYLDDPLKNDLTLVNVLIKKGDGNFPLDSQIEEAQKKLKEAQSKKT